LNSVLCKHKLTDYPLFKFAFLNAHHFNLTSFFNWDSEGDITELQPFFCPYCERNLKATPFSHIIIGVTQVI